MTLWVIPSHWGVDSHPAIPVAGSIVTWIGVAQLWSGALVVSIRGKSCHSSFIFSYEKIWHHGCSSWMSSYTLWSMNIDPENYQFLVETNLPTPMTARVYVNLLEGICHMVFLYVFLIRYFHDYHDSWNSACVCRFPEMSMLWLMASVIIFRSIRYPAW